MKTQKTTKVIKVICIVVAVVIAAGLIQLGRYEYVKKYKITPIDSSVSADRNYELLFQSVGEADWPFGTSHARFVLKHDGKDVTKYKLDVENDGKDLCAENWQVTWKDSLVEVLIFGEEQQDALYTLSFDGTVKTEPAEETE